MGNPASGLTPEEVKRLVVVAPEVGVTAEGGVDMGALAHLLVAVRTWATARQRSGVLGQLPAGLVSDRYFEPAALCTLEEHLIGSPLGALHTFWASSDVEALPGSS